MDRFTASLKRFSDAVADPNWTQESEYILEDIAHSIKASKVFVQRDLRVEGHVVVAEIEWTGDGFSLNDVSRDFWMLYMDFAEYEQFITHQVESNAIVFHILTGNSQGHTTHGHAIVIRLVGTRIREIIRDYFALGEQLGPTNS